MESLSTDSLALAFLTALITPAILILACASLISSCLMRLARVVDRVRTLTQMSEDIRLGKCTAASVEGSLDPRTREAFFIVRPDRGQLNEITRLIDAAQLRPVVDCVFPLAQARQAFEHKPTRGKVVLSVADGEGAR